MQGAAVTKNIRRTGIPATIKGRPNPAYPIDLGTGPTRQRLNMAEGFFVVGDDKQGGKIHTMRDDPLSRMFARSVISGAEYAALQKYHHHWYHAGLEMGVGTVDLNRVFSSDPGSMSGMAKTEGQAHHRKQWREAREKLGHRVGIVVDNVVCAGHTLEAAGFSVGWRSKPQAIAASTEMLRDAGYRLAKLWGIG
jgi:hypothetical protein